MYILFHSNRCATLFFCKPILTATNTSWSLDKIVNHFCRQSVYSFVDLSFSLSFSAFVLMYFLYFLFVRWYYYHDWIIILLLYRYCITLLKFISYLHCQKKVFLKLHNYTEKLYHLCFISSTFVKYLIESYKMLGMTTTTTKTTTKNRMSPHNKIRLKKDFPRNSVLDALMIIMIIIILIIDKNDYGIVAHQSQLGTNKVLIEQNEQ